MSIKLQWQRMTIIAVIMCAPFCPRQCLAQNGWVPRNSTGTVLGTPPFGGGSCFHSVSGSFVLSGNPPPWNAGDYMPAAGAAQWIPTISGLGDVACGLTGVAGTSFGISTMNVTDTISGYMKWTGAGKAPANQMFLITPALEAQAFIVGDVNATATATVTDTTFPSLMDPLTYGPNGAHTGYKGVYPNPAESMVESTTPISGTGTPQDGTASFTVNSDYSLELNSNGDSSSSKSSAAAWEDFVMTPIGISLTGPSTDSFGNVDILVGQQCTASVYGIPNPTGLQYTYAWTVSGTTFQSWTPTTPAIGTSPANPNAPYLSSDSGSFTQSEPSWYWNDPSHITETVTCVVTAPAGANITPATFTLTQPVSVYLPSFTATGVPGVITVQNNVAGAASDYYLVALGANNQNPHGMTWNISNSTPGGTTFATGTLEIVQLFTPTRSFTAPNASLVSTVYNLNQNSTAWLDTQYPYPGSAGSSGLYTQPASPGDNPGMNLTTPPPPADGTATAASMTDGFADTLMYEPPGSMQFVPIATFNWNTSGSAAIPEGGWANGSGASGTVTDTSGNLFTASNAWPTWTQILAASNETFSPAN